MSWPKAGAGTGKGLASAAGRCISVGICGAGFAAVRPGGGHWGTTHGYRERKTTSAGNVRSRAFGLYRLI